MTIIEETTSLDASGIEAGFQAGFETPGAVENAERMVEVMGTMVARGQKKTARLLEDATVELLRTLYEDGCGFVDAEILAKAIFSWRRQGLLDTGADVDWVGTKTYVQHNFREMRNVCRNAVRDSVYRVHEELSCGDECAEVRAAAAAGRAR